MLRRDLYSPIIPSVVAGKANDILFDGSTRPEFQIQIHGVTTGRFDWILRKWQRWQLT
jgi:hypothetical protein